MFKSRFLRVFACALSFGACMAFSACAQAPAAQQVTVAQVVSVICPIAKDAIDDTVTAGVFTGGAAVTLTKQVEPDFDAVCVAGATVTVANLSNLANATFPAIEAAIANSSLSADDKKDVLLGITTVRATLQVYIALNPQAAPIATAPDSASSVAGQ